MASTHDPSADSLFPAYEAFFLELKYPRKAARLLALAARSKCRAEGSEPDAEETHERFLNAAQRTIFQPLTSDEDVAVLEALSLLVGVHPETPVPSWANEALRELNWLQLYKARHADHGAFFDRARELGLEPDPRDRLQDADQLPEDLKDCVLKDAGCRRIWRDRIAAKPPEEHVWYVEQVVHAASDADVQRYFCELLADDLRLVDEERNSALADPGRFVVVVRSARTFHKTHKAAVRLLVRRWLHPHATWDDLPRLSDVELVGLVKHWAEIIAGRSSSGTTSDAEYLKDDANDYIPILREVMRRGRESLTILAGELLTAPPCEDAKNEDWRGALLDLSNLLTQPIGRILSSLVREGGRHPLPSIPSTNEWHEVMETLAPALSEAIATRISAEPEQVAQLKPWTDILAGERRPGITNVAARLLDLALQGLGRAGRWEIIEQHLPNLSGKSERHVRIRESAMAAVAAATKSDGRMECEKFLIRLLNLGPSHLDDLAPQLAVAFALQSESEEEDVLSSPEKAQLNSFGVGFHPGALARDELVGLARRLKMAPNILDALVEFFRALPATKEVRIALPGALVGQARRLMASPETLGAMVRWAGGVPVNLGDLLHATGDPRLNPDAKCTWSRRWDQLACWHLGAGHGIEEFFKDSCHPRHGNKDHLPLGELPPDQVQAWMSDMIIQSKDEETPELSRALLLHLDRILMNARNPDLLPHYRLHEGWKQYAAVGVYPDGACLEDLPPRELPREHMPVLEVIYNRLRTLAAPTNDAWKLFATLATLLSDNPAYPRLVTTDVKEYLIEDAKGLLMDLRTKAPSASSDDERAEAGLNTALSILSVFKDFSATIRQLLLIYREIPFACLPPSLAAHLGSEGKAWFIIPHAITFLLRIAPPGQREDIRFAIADFLQDRLKPRKAGIGSAPAGTNPSMIEPDPIVREAYVEALADLRTDRGGRIHRLLGNVALSDPSDQVKEVARRCAARARKAGKESPRGSLGRFILNAWWQIRRGTTLRFGSKMVDAGRAQNTKVMEATFLRGEKELN